MPGVVDDAMLDAFVPSAPYSEIAALLRSWYGELSSWINFPMPADPAEDRHAARAITELREGVS